MTTVPAPTSPPADTGVLASVRAAFRAGRRRLLGYLLVTLALVGLTLVALPATPAETPDPQAAPRLEYIPIEGDGLFAPVSRASLRTTAWLAATTVDGQAALLRPTPLAARAGIPITQALHRWQDRDLANLRLALVAVIAALAAAVAFVGAGRRPWIIALAGMLLVSVLVTRPAQVLTAAGAPGRLLAGSGLVLVAGETSQRQLGDQYWSAYVTAHVSHATTGTPILTQAAPADRGGLLAVLQWQVPGLGGGGAGSFQAAVVGAGALVLNTVVAVFAWSTAAAAVVAQTLLFLLVLAGLLVGPLALNRRRWRGIWRYWLMPLTGAAGVTFAASLGSWLVVGLAVALASTGELVLSMLPGSTLAGISVVLAWRWARRRFRVRLVRPTPPPPTPAAAEAGTGAPAAGTGKEAAA